MKHRPGLWLTVVLAIFYTVLGNDRIGSGDGETMFQVTRALAENGRLHLPPGILSPVDVTLTSDADTEIPYTITGRDGRTYAKYGLGQSLAALPLYLLGMAGRALTGNAHLPRAASLVLNGLLTAATAGLLFALARELGFSTRTGIIVALAFALCTPAWAYTHTFFSEPLVTFCLTGAGLAGVRFVRQDRTIWLVVMGSALGLALLTKISALAALPAFALYLICSWRDKGSPLPLIARQAAAGLVALGATVGLILLYNLLRSGRPFDFGYHTANWQTPFLQGLAGLTLSSGKGILWYAPPVILGIIGLPSFARRFPRVALFCVGLPLSYLLLHSLYTYWAGGWCWGPRLILPALPFAILPIGSLMERQQPRQIVELGLALLLVLGFLVQVPAVGSNYAHPLQQAYQSSPEGYLDRVLYQPAHSPLFRQWPCFLGVIANLRQPAARAQISRLLANARPEDILPFTGSAAEALRLKRQTILSYNLPDLWLVTRPWLRPGAGR
jgi:hypothetical protein